MKYGAYLYVKQDSISAVSISLCECVLDLERRKPSKFIPIMFFVLFSRGGTTAYSCPLRCGRPCIKTRWMANTYMYHVSKCPIVYTLYFILYTLYFILYTLYLLVWISCYCLISLCVYVISFY